MAGGPDELKGPDFEHGYEAFKLSEGKMLLGHAFGEAILVARRGDDFFAIGATCPHLWRAAGGRSDGGLYRALSLAPCPF